ncbi:MAG: phospho-sugar mutase [Acholeplasma sp.]|nr:phospho-sugar mutase [Acholeplasma sp.]
MNYQTQYNKWMNYPNLDKDLKAELLLLNETQIEEAFYTDIEFGTGGIRGLMGPGTNRMNVYTIMRATLGFGHYILSLKGKKRVAISYDNRHNSEVFALRSAGVLASLGIEVVITKSLRPTPYLSFMTRHFDCDGGIMITASHNPKEYNGFKVYDKEGCQLVPAYANIVIDNISGIQDFFEIQFDESSKLIQWIDSDFDRHYLNEVKKIELERFATKNLKLVYSPLHGTGGTLIPSLLEEMGYKVYPVSSQMTVDPNFSHAESSNPEETLAYKESIEFAKSIDADLILVTDPDADRLGVMVKHQGKYHFLTGNQTASLTLHYVLSRRKAQNILPENGYVFSTNVTTPLITKIARSFNATVVETLTGFKFIGEQAKKIEGNGVYLFGCEESYGSLIRDFVRDKDAVQAVYMLSEMATYEHQFNRTLIDALEDIYKEYGFFVEETLNINLKGIEGKQKIEAIMSHFRKYGLSIKNKELTQIDDCLLGTSWTKVGTKALELPTSNVLKFYYRDGSWVVFRPSGTEPKLKIYISVKGDSKEASLDMLDNYKIVINGLVAQI